MITYTDVTNAVKKNSKKTNINMFINPEFEQDIDIPKTVIPKISNSHINNLNVKEKEKQILLGNNKPNIDKKPEIIPTKTLIQYVEGEIINLPKKIGNILDLNKYYSFGMNHLNSILYSILFIIDKSFKLANENDKKALISQFINLLIANLDKSFKEFKLSQYGVKKTIINKQLKDNNVDNYLCIYIQKYLKINLVMIDPLDETYEIKEDYNESLNNVIIMKYIHEDKTLFLPIASIYGKLPENDVCQHIFKTYKRINVKEEINYSNELKDIKSYTAQEIQKLSSFHKINLYNVTDEGKNKKKTKAQLYNEIKQCIMK